MAANQTVSFYGNKPPTFIKESPTLHKREVFGLNFPLGKNKDKGGFFQKTSGVELIKDAVTQLLRTQRGERILLPRYGCNLRPYLFQPLDEVTFEGIKEEIRFSFSRYIVGATIDKLAVFPTGPAGPAGGNSLIIRLTLRLNQKDLTVFDVEVQIK